jgi:hypothetical protein
MKKLFLISISITGWIATYWVWKYSESYFCWSCPTLTGLWWILTDIIFPIVFVVIPITYSIAFKE